MCHTYTRTVEEVIIEPDKTYTKVIAEYGVIRDRITVIGEVYHGHQTGHRIFFKNAPDEIGTVHDAIARAFPWLRPLIDLHMADVYTGEPMFALGNGWFYLQDPNSNRDRAAQYLRTTPDMLANVATKEDLNNLIDTTLAPAWKKQIDAVLTLYDLPIKHKLHENLNSMIIVYTDENGCLYDQPLGDLPDVGTLIDPDSGDDMGIVGYKLV